MKIKNIVIFCNCNLIFCGLKSVDFEKKMIFFFEFIENSLESNGLNLKEFFIFYNDKLPKSKYFTFSKKITLIQIKNKKSTILKSLNENLNDFVILIDLNPIEKIGVFNDRFCVLNPPISFDKKEKSKSILNDDYVYLSFQDVIKKIKNRNTMKSLLKNKKTNKKIKHVKFEDKVVEYNLVKKNKKILKWKEKYSICDETYKLIKKKPIKEKKLKINYEILKKIFNINARKLNNQYQYIFKNKKKRTEWIQLVSSDTKNWIIYSNNFITIDQFLKDIKLI